MDMTNVTLETSTGIEHPSQVSFPVLWRIQAAAKLSTCCHYAKAATPKELLLPLTKCWILQVFGAWSEERGILGNASQNTLYPEPYLTNKLLVRLFWCKRSNSFRICYFHGIVKLFLASNKLLVPFSSFLICCLLSSVSNFQYSFNTSGKNTNLKHEGWFEKQHWKLNCWKKM